MVGLYSLPQIYWSKVSEYKHFHNLERKFIFIKLCEVDESLKKTRTEVHIVPDPAWLALLNRIHIIRGLILSYCAYVIYSKGICVRRIIIYIYI